MRQIQKELGEGDDTAAEIEELKKAIDAAGMPEDVAQARRQGAEAPAAHGRGQRRGLDAAHLPRVACRAAVEGRSRRSRSTSPKPRKVLDEDHFGLDKIKRRILEHLAVRKLNPSGKSPILCFVGPPGVGKTSLGQSIARATGRKFQRIALGGVHDEAEIRGHRRTYIGALPGNIIQALRRAGVEEHGADVRRDRQARQGGFHGDPSSALLEVLDPEQNSTLPRQLPRRATSTCRR